MIPREPFYERRCRTGYRWVVVLEEKDVGCAIREPQGFGICRRNRNPYLSLHTRRCQEAPCKT